MRFIKTKRQLYPLEPLLLLATLAVIYPQVVSAESTEAPAQQEVLIESLINYHPKSTDFPKVISSAIPSISNIELKPNLTQGELADPSSDKRLNADIEATNVLLKKLSRGYRDELYFLRGLLHEARGDTDAALNDYKTSLTYRASNPVPLFRHAFLLKSKNNCKGAIPEFKEVRWRTIAAEHETLYLLAECQIAENDKESALKSLELAYAKNPEFTPAGKLLLELRGEILASAKDPAKKAQLEQETIQYLIKVTRQNPADKDSALQLARLLLKSGDPLLNPDKLQQAEALARKVVKDTGFKDEFAVRLLFDSQVKRRDLPNAEKTLRQGLKISPNSKILVEANEQLALEKGLAG